MKGNLKTTLGSFQDQQIDTQLSKCIQSIPLTEIAILNRCDNVVQNMENTNPTVVALDLSAAFDTVNHKILLEVLNK